MAKKGSLSECSIEELYTREEAAERLNRGIGTVDRMVSLEMFTREYTDHSKRLYLRKSEVEHMVGYDEAPLTSKKAQARLAAFRRQQEVEKTSGSLDNLSADNIEREVSHHMHPDNNYWSTMREYAEALNRFGKMIERGVMHV